MRLAPVVAGVVLAGLLAPAASAHSRAVGDAPTARIGHLAYVSKSNEVHVAYPKVTGNVTHDEVIGPVTSAPAGRSIAIQSFVGSPDGQWLAWSEVVTKANGDPTGVNPTLVIREFAPSQVYQLKTSSLPLGFSDDTLIVYNGAHASAVQLSPTTQLKTIPGTDFPQAAYPGGVVNVKSYTSPPGPKSTYQVRLTALDGSAKIVHNYVLAASDPHLPEQSFVSPDGKVLAIEQGDHTDFGGIGTSSKVDEFSLTGKKSRVSIGHYGSAKAQWRVGAMSFAWENDEPWVVWERGTRKGAKSVLAVYQHHKWRRIIKHGIAVVGNANGFVIAQPGKYVFNHDGLGYTRVPTGDALLLHDQIVKVTGISGSAFAWVK